MTNRLGQTAIFFSVILALPLSGACKKLMPGGDDGGLDGGGTASTEDAAAAAPAAAAPKATNESDIARFTDETKLDNVAVQIKQTARVRESPPSGPQITTLAPGANVTEIAGHDKYFLITFDDPKNAGQRLMGWIYQDVLSAAAPQPPSSAARAVTCPPGLTLLLAETVVCGKMCVKDADCGAGEACRGTAQQINGTKLSSPIPVCAPAKPAAPVLPSQVIDAGGPKVTPSPSGGPVTPVAPVAPAAGGIIVEPVAGKCGAGYSMLTKDKKCHKNCPTASDCGNSSCVRGCAGAAGTVCVATRDFCK